jgi:protein gp37
MTKLIDRIDFLRKTKAKVKFLSLEPLIGPLPNLKPKKN